MMSSVFAGIDMVELKDSKEMDTSGRAAYELVLHDVLEPRETFVDQAGNTRNGIDVGDAVKFRPIILNDGDNSQTEFNIHVTVAASAAPTTLIIDNTDDAVCPGTPSVTGCSFNDLAPGDFLGGGSYNVQSASGGDLTWSPTIPGEYTITVSVEVLSSTHDDDLTNNDMTYNVVVQHYHDIELALCWTDGPGGECSSEQGAKQGEGPHNFAMSANVSGSESWNPRSTNIDVEFTGSYLAQETSLTVGTTACQTATCSVTLGDAEMVDVWFNSSNADQTDPGSPCPANDNPCRESRTVAAFGTVYTYHGVIKGDAGAASGVEQFGVEAHLISFDSYEAHVEESMDPGNPEAGTSQAVIWDEVTMDYDDRTGNNDDSLSGYFSVFHDIALTSLTGGSNEAAEGTLNTGDTVLKASVVPGGSSPDNSYDWEVQFTVTDDAGNAVDLMGGYAVECLTDDEDSYTHTTLGDQPPSAPEGTACITVNLQPGRYTVTATANLLDPSLTDGDTTNNCGEGTNRDCWSDMNGGNDMRGTYFDVINDNPTIFITLDAITRDGNFADPPAIVGDEVTLRARGLDTESQDSLTYSWTRSNAMGQVTPIQCIEGPGSEICTDITDMTWIGSRTVTATVTDEHGASSSDSMTLTVWNKYDVDLSVTGADMSYSLVYAPVVQANLSAADMILADCDDEVLGNNPGSFACAVAFELTSTNLFSPAEVGGESLVVTYAAGTPGTDYDLWFSRDGTSWTALGTTVEAATNGGVTLTLTRSGNMPNMESGSYAIFETSSTGGDPPATGITGLTADLEPDARVDFTWALSDSGSANANTDFIHIYYCVDDGSGCDAVADGTSVTGQSITTTSWTLTGSDATTYNVVVRVENGNTDANGNKLFGTPVASSTVTADGMVSPAPVVADVTGAPNTANDAMAFTWTATDTDDVEKWMICWGAFEFDSDGWNGLVSEFAESGNGCALTEDTTTSLTVTEAAICGGACNAKLYFGITGVDDVGNVATSDAVLYMDASDGLDIPDTIITDDGGDAGGSDAPQQAMYAIIALVVLAVIGGAFILTRGGGGEGDDKEWDY